MNIRKCTERIEGVAFQMGTHEDLEVRMSLTCSRKRRKASVNSSMVNEKEAGRKSGWIMEFDFYSEFNEELLEVTKNITLTSVQ